LDQGTLKALQERVVKLAGDARTLIDPLFQTQIEYLCHPTDAVPIQPPEQCQKSGYTRGPEPKGLPEQRIDPELDCPIMVAPDPIRTSRHQRRSSKRSLRISNHLKLNRRSYRYLFIAVGLGYRRTMAILHVEEFFEFLGFMHDVTSIDLQAGYCYDVE
jgi:hypothetical protein